ncbi:MAG: HEAT repeat domain-containing protein [Thermodesulfovibrionales bacterium]|nr:HEAT repeat domain-containing protein [Thermodesulfovibrionales bacterium]
MKNIRRLIQKLSSPDPTVRKMAAESLSEGDERAIYPLIKALNDENPGVQDAAMRALINIGTEEVGYMTLPLLRENVLLRNTALIILTSLGSKVVPLLYNLLKDKDDDVRKFVLDLFSDIKEGVDPQFVIPMLKDPNPNVRAAAAKTLGKLNYRPAIPLLIESLKDEEWVCFSALEALGDLQALEAVKDISALLHSESIAVVSAAIETLGKIGSEEAIDPLVEILPSADDETKKMVIKSLVSIGLPPNIPDICEHLIAMLKESDWDEREIAIKGITSANCKNAVPVLIDMCGEIDPTLPEFEDKIPLFINALLSIDSEEELLKLLDREDVKFRGKAIAIEILGDLKSRAAIPKLVSFLNDVRRDLRKASVGALGHIGEPEVIEPLLTVSRKDPDSHVRKAAVNALGKMQTKDAYVPLLEMLEIEKYYDIIECIVKALINIDAPSFLSDIKSYNRNVRMAIAKSVQDVNVLKELANDNDKQIKMIALQSLGKTKSSEALELLISYLKDPDAEIRKSALIGIAESECCCQEIYDALNDEDDWVRFYALQTLLVSCGRDIDFGLISKMLNDPFPPVVISCVEMLRDIGGAEAYEALMQIKDHDNPEIRMKVEEVLSQL